MIEIHPEYIVDEKSNKKSVVIPITEWESLLIEMEELDDIKAYDVAKSREEGSTTFEQAVNEIKAGTVK